MLGGHIKVHHPKMHHSIEIFISSRLVKNAINGKQRQNSPFISISEMQGKVIGIDRSDVSTETKTRIKYTRKQIILMILASLSAFVKLSQCAGVLCDLVPFVP
jgi:hypothetical protein